MVDWKGRHIHGVALDRADGHERGKETTLLPVAHAVQVLELLETKRGEGRGLLLVPEPAARRIEQKTPVA